MSRIIQPVVSPRGRVIVLTGATLWLVAAMVLSAVPDGASAAPGILTAAHVLTTGAPLVIEKIAGTDEILFRPNVVFDRRGGLFVADYGNHHVVQLNDDLTARTVFGREGAGPGEMQVPYGVAVDNDGNVFVADLALHRINKFAPDATFIKSVAAPQVTKLLIDSHDQLIVYPAPGPALLQRYSNDLEPGEELLQESDVQMHRSRMGVLMAMDERDRLFVLDQMELELTIYDRDMEVLQRWPVDGPELQESITRGLASAKANNPDGNVRVPGFQSMALDPGGGHIAFAYLVRRPNDVIFTRIVWYTTAGEQLATEDRGDLVFTNALLQDGRVVEGTAEELLVFTRGPQPAGARGNN